MADDLEHLQQLVKTLQHDNSSLQNLSNALKEEVKELTTQLASMKKETLILKAQIANSNDGLPAEPSNGSQKGSTPSCSVQNEASSLTSADNKLSESKQEDENEEYQKMDNYVLYYHNPSGYYYESVTQQFLCPYSSGTNTEESASNDTKIDTDNDAHTHSEPQTQSSPPHSQTTTDPNEPSTSSDSTAPQDVPKGDIASQLAAVSDSAMQQYGFTYDETSGYYYDERTGLYYDQTNQVYYNPQLGTYYTFNTESGQYEPYCTLDVPVDDNTDDPSSHTIERDTRTLESRVVHESKMYLEMIQELEAESQEGAQSPPPVNEWPPCVRIVPRLDSAHLAVNENDARMNVNLITAEGVEIGRDVSGPQSLRIMDMQISKLHCEIRYLRRRESFAVTDLGSQNGTYLNGERISEPKEKSKPHLLLHRDILTIGSTPFLLHIHHGLSSCSECAEVGSFKAPSDATSFSSEPVYNESLDVQRRKELNKIKKKYGLRTKDTYNEKPYQLSEKYADKSAERRLKVGSDLPEGAIRDDLPSSTNRAIADTNKGKQMLKKFGWEEGQGLGRNNAGIQEPVTAVIRDERSGLGFGFGARDIASVNNQKSETKSKMYKHFQQVVDRDAKRKKSSE